MKIKFDEKILEVTDPNLNIVEIAKNNGITIPSPCYNTNCKFGCCKGCIIEIEGKIHYACCTKPTAGMKIIFEREDLKELRREKIKQYAYNIKHGIANKCDCSAGEDSCSCGTGCC